MQRSREYWQERFQQLEQAVHDFAEDIFKDISDYYAITMQGLERDITGWYQRYAYENDMSYAEARKLLNSKEMRSFRLDLKSYIKAAELAGLSEVWQKKLNSYYMRMRISRLEALQLMIQQHLEVLFGNQLDSLDNSLKQLYTEGYYHTAFNIQQGAGVGTSFTLVDTNKLDAVLAKPWASDGRNFSSRIWEHKDNLVGLLNIEMTQAVIRGDDYSRVINTVARKMNVSRANAGRLVMTEAAFIGTKAQQDCFKELDVEQYEFIATLDKRTSEICREMDGKVFKLSDMKIGTNAPPLHPHCRSCTAPYFDDAEDLERTARSKNGKPYKVSADMSYKEWKEKYVPNYSEKSVQPSNKNVIINKEDTDKLGGNNMHLEQAKKRDHKIMINEIAISKVPLVKIKGLSLAECEMLQQEHKEILKIAMEQNNSNEILSVVQMSLGNSIKVFGNESGVNPLNSPAVYSLFVNSERHSLAFLHNHPSTNNFSLADIATFLQTKELGLMSVVTNQGEVHVLRKSDSFNFRYAINLAKQAYKNYVSTELTHNDAVKQFLQNCRKGGVIYEHSK